jgi:hypothetical protein
MAATNVQAFPGNVTVSDAIIADNGTKHSLTIDASSSLIYNKELPFNSISAHSNNYVGRFSIYAPPAIFSIVDSGNGLGSGSRYSMAKHYGVTTKPIVNALEGSHFTRYTFVWQANGNTSYDVWFKPNRAGNYSVYVHAKDYTFPTAPESPTYLDVLYGLVNLSDGNGGLAHAIIGAPGAYGNASLQLFNNGQTTNNRLTHEAIQLFSNTTPATGAISNVYITMTPSTVNNGYGGYIEGWIKSGTAAGLTIGSINSGTKYAGITVVGTTAKVGIGTTNPLGLLHLSSGTTGDAHLIIESDTDNSNENDNPRITFRQDGGYLEGEIGLSDNNMVFRSRSTTSGNTGFIWYSNVSDSGGHSKTDLGDLQAEQVERMRLTGDGNVGIGTNTPGAPFEVHGPDLTGAAAGTTSLISRHVSGLDGVLNIFGVSAANGEETLGLQTQIDNRAWATDIAGGWATGDVTRYDLLLQPYKGSVGIGTTNPFQKLHVNGNIYLGDNTSDSNCIIHGGVNLAVTSDSAVLIVCDANDNSGGGTAGSSIIFGMGSAHDTHGDPFGMTYDNSYRPNDGGGPRVEHMRITNGGLVGIGTNNPAKKLHIKQSVAVSQGPGNAIRIEQATAGEHFDIGMDNDENGADLYFNHSAGHEFIMGGDDGGYFVAPSLHTQRLTFTDRLSSSPNSHAGSIQLIRTSDSADGGLFQSTDRGGLILGSPDDSLFLATGDQWVDSFSESSHGINLEAEHIYMVADGELRLNLGIQNGYNAEYHKLNRLHHYLDGRGSGSTASHFTYYRNHGGSLYSIGYSGSNTSMEIHSDNTINMYESDNTDLVFSFDVNNDKMYLNGSQVIPSDDRLKINETRITNATQTLLKLDPQLYDKKRFLDSNILTHEAGFISQDVWYDVPEFRYLVSLADDAEPSKERPFTPDDIQDDPDWEGAGWGEKVSSLNYGGMLPFIVKSIQEIVTELPTEKTQVLSEGDLYGLIVSATTNTFTAGDKPILKLSNVYCDKACFGVVSAVKPATRLDSETLVNTNGSGRIWVLDTGTPLTSGDYVTTSNSIAGYAQIQPDDITRNYTVAKITQECDFIEKTRPKRIIKQKLADVNYYVKTNYIKVTQDEYNALSQDKRTSEEEVYYECQGKEKVESDQPYDYVKIKPEITMENYENLSDIEKNRYKLRYFKYVTTEEMEEPSADVTFERKTRTLYKRIVKQYYTTQKRYRELEVRNELVNFLDENGQMQWEDDPSGATEKAYKIRYIDADGNITDEASHVYKAAFVGCTYHCG